MDSEHQQNTKSWNAQSSSNIDYAEYNDIGDHIEFPYTFDCPTEHIYCDDRNVAERNIIANFEETCSQTLLSLPECLRHKSSNKLKDSTKDILRLLDGIRKTHPKNTVSNDPNPSIDTKSKALSAVTDLVSNQENEDTNLDDDEDDEDDVDDCSVYKRLTRKCHCLNRLEYNDFMIHFNESTKYFTSTMGEIIKNMRILKKFLYMGGHYARHALIFLNEGFSYSTHLEKVEITQGCAYADICNVFDDQSVVVVCITGPSDSDINRGDPSTQALTASFLNKLIQLEEGRRYLKFSSKITCDLKKVIRKNSTKLEYETLEFLNSTLNILNPPTAQNTNVTYYCKPVDEGFGSKTVSALLKYRQFMTLEEVFTHLDLLHNLSNSDNGRNELNTFLGTLLNLFTQILQEYDNSEMNIIVMNILNNIVSRSMIKPMALPKTVIMADTATDPIQMKNETIQIPIKKNNKKERVGLGISPYKFRQPSKVKVKGLLEPPVNKSRKFSKDPNCSIIVVPIEE